MGRGKQKIFGFADNETFEEILEHSFCDVEKIYDFTKYIMYLVDDEYIGRRGLTITNNFSHIFSFYMDSFIAIIENNNIIASFMVQHPPDLQRIFALARIPENNQNDRDINYVLNSAVQRLAESLAQLYLR